MEKRASGCRILSGGWMVLLLVVAGLDDIGAGVAEGVASSGSMK